MTLNKPFMFENLQYDWIKTLSAQKSGPKFLHSDVKDLLSIISNA